MEDQPVKPKELSAMLSRVGGALTMDDGRTAAAALDHTSASRNEVHVGDVVHGHTYHGIHGHSDHHRDPLAHGGKFLMRDVADGDDGPGHKLLNASHMAALTSAHMHSQSHTDMAKVGKKAANLEAVWAKKVGSGHIVVEHDHEQHGEQAPVEMHKQGNLGMYTEDNVVARQSLRHHKDVEDILDQMWVSAARHHSADQTNLDKEEYRSVHARMLRACTEKEDIDMTKEEMDEAFEDDWEMDSGGDGSVQKEDFLDSLFQLTDTWCETVELDEYTGYLKWLQARMFKAPDRWFNFKKTIKFCFNKEGNAALSCSLIRFETITLLALLQCTRRTTTRRSSRGRTRDCWPCPPSTPRARASSSRTR
jgi:hypothetical protein